MKPDWQNKSYAKTGSPIGPSTMSDKLKCGMSSLHSKISAANSNMPQAPKPMVRKFADGGTVRTRSDDEIGDTDPRTGKVDPGSYDRRMKAGEENLTRLKSAAESVRSFFTREKAVSLDEPKPTMSEADVEKRQATGRFGEDMNKQAEPVKMPESKAEEPSYKQDVLKEIIKPKAVSTTVVEPKTEPVVSLKSNAEVNAKPLPAAKKKADAKLVEASPVKTNSAVGPTQAEIEARIKANARLVSSLRQEEPEKKSVQRTGAAVKAGASQKAVELMILEKKGLAGNEADKRAEQAEIDRASKTDTGDETNRLRDRTSKFVPGFGQVDLKGDIIPGVRGGLKSSQVYGGDGSTVMSRAEKKYLQSRIDAGNMTAMEKAQAKRAGLL
tara:strand:- start:2201 stop:3352 length:1152 start_codon:yes stop_codon:yes gene_type:complete